jgi:hypothetical protein
MTVLTLFYLAPRIGTLARAESGKTATTLKWRPVHLPIIPCLAHCNLYSNTPAAAKWLFAMRALLGQTIASGRETAQSGVAARQSSKR